MRLGHVMNSQQWWEATTKTVSVVCRAHDSHTDPTAHSRSSWLSAASLLMASLPDPLREEVVASKAITTLGILSKAMLQYYIPTWWTGGARGHSSSP